MAGFRRNRRAIITMALGAAATTVIAACAPPATPTEAPAPTQAPSAPQAPKPTAAPAPTTVPAATTAPGEQVTTIRYSDWQSDLNRPALNANEKKFGIKVVDEHAPFGEFAQKLITQYAGGTAPDVSQVSHDWWGDFFRLDVLAPLDDALTKASIDPKLWYAPLEKMCAYRGKVLGLPYAIAEAPGIWVNKTAAEKEGIKLPEFGTPGFDTWHWGDALKFWQAMTKRKSDGSVDQWGLAKGYRGGMTGFDKLLVWEWANDVRLFDDDWGFGETECLVNSKPWVDFHQYQQDLVKRHKVAMDPDTLKAVNGAQGAFASGKAISVMTWSNPSILGAEQKFEQTVIMAPWEARRAYLIGFVSYTVNKNSKVLDDALAFAIRMTTDEEVMAVQTKTNANTVVYNTRRLIEKYMPKEHHYWFEVEVARNPAVTSVPDIAKDAVPVPSFSGRAPGFAIDTVITELEKAYAGQKTVQQALDDAAKAITTRLKTVK